jgi:hypothetical protein
MLRILQDYVVLYFGSSMYKIARLLVIAMISVYLFACAFYRVKKESADSPEDVESFYESRNVLSTVCIFSCCFAQALAELLVWGQDLPKAYVSTSFCIDCHTAYAASISSPSCSQL